MNLLGLDTTSRHASIAVLRDEELLSEYHFAVRDDLAAMLAPGLEFLLRSLGLAADGIDLFGVAVGPGLFTGIRVGLATVKGMNLALGRPVAAVNALEALALQSADLGPLVVPMIDARQGEVYLAAYALEHGELRPLLAPRLLRLEQAQPLLQPLAAAVFVGSGAETHADSLRRLFPEGQLRHGSRFLACQVGRIALRRFRAGGCLTDLQDLRPAYIRSPDAEAKLSGTPRNGD